MKLFRAIVFWAHLSAGVVAGLIILIMSVTGAAVAFDPQITAWAERSGRDIEPVPGGAARLTLDQLLARAKAARPNLEPMAATFFPGADTAVRISAGRDAGVFVDPIRGTVTELGGGRWREFSQFMVRWHRWLGAQEGGRDLGKAITGVATLALMFMACSGLYLWWPRRWTRRVLRGSIWFRRGLAGRARDWNWHNTLGFWALPVILVLTVSGSMIAYDWAKALVYRAAGDTYPARGGGSAPAVALAPRPPGPPRLALDALHAQLDQQAPSWTSATLRLRGREEPGAKAGAPRALVLSVKQANIWPRAANLQIWLDPDSGQVLRREGFDDATSGRKAQIWLRYLHTGEALGWPGQLAALLATLACGALVLTGAALALRRFYRRRAPVSDEAADAASLAP